MHPAIDCVACDQSTSLAKGGFGSSLNSFLLDPLFAKT